MRYFVGLFFLLGLASFAETDSTHAKNDSSANAPVVQPRRPVADEPRENHGILGTGRRSSFNGKEFQISTVSEDYAQELFDKMAKVETIPFRYPEDGCYARAHEMAMRMEKDGVFTGKVFIEGSLRVETKNSPKGYVEWWYHVAPTVLVKKNGKEELYVIDPSLFNKAVPAEEWYAIQTKHVGGRRDRTYQTKRFNYTPSGKDTDMNKFDDSDVQEMRRTLEAYLLLQKGRQKGELK